MVLGLIGLVGIIALRRPHAGALAVRVVPRRARRSSEIDANPGSYAGREMAIAGKVMGIIGTVLLILGSSLAFVAFIAWAVSLDRRVDFDTTTSELAADQHRLVDEPDAEPRLDAVADLAGQGQQVGGGARRRGW